MTRTRGSTQVLSYLQSSRLGANERLGVLSDDHEPNQGEHHPESNAGGASGNSKTSEHKSSFDLNANQRRCGLLYV